MIFLNECYLVKRTGISNDKKISRLFVTRLLTHVLLYKVGSGLCSLKNGLPPQLSLPYLGCVLSASCIQIDGNNSSSYDLLTERLKNKFLTRLTTCQFCSLFSKHRKLRFPSTSYVLGVSESERFQWEYSGFWPFLRS